MTNTDFRLKKMLRDREGDPIPQFWDEDLKQFIPQTIQNSGGHGGGGQGPRGYSSYEIALRNGFTGTEVEWLASLKGERGEKGEPGKDATPMKFGNSLATATDVQILLKPVQP